MKKSELNIVFMGTPEFSVPSLEILVENGYNVVAVITATDKYGGRGKKKLIESAVKKCAQKHGIPILQPKNLKDPDFQEALAAYDADLQVVVAFRMLPVSVWDMPPLGTINLHASLLPKYRGAAPINWAIIRGEKVTGLTTFKLKHAIDTGDMIFQTEVPIEFEDSAGTLHDKLMVSGAELVLKTVDAIADGQVHYKKQDDSAVSKAPKIYHDDCHIDWNKDVTEVHNFIRGLSPYPCAWSLLDGEKIKIYKATPVTVDANVKPSTIKTDNKNFLRVYCKNGYLELNEVQLQGRKRMDVKAFLNGTDISSDRLA